MIIYNPLDGHTFPSSPEYRPKNCFLMTRLGGQIPKEVNDIRDSVTNVCRAHEYDVVDANTTVTGRDFLLKIWKLIAETPLSIGVVQRNIPARTQANIFYELGVAQALGKETLIIKCAKSKVPSDFTRTEYIEFNDQFDDRFGNFMSALQVQAGYYETVAEQLDRNPLLAIDYIRRAFLITGNANLKQKTQEILESAGLENRAKNSVEVLAAAFASG